MSRKRKEPEERCPHCGCPELLTYGRVGPGGFMVVTSCPGCKKVIQPAPPVETPKPAPSAEPEHVCQAGREVCDWPGCPMNPNRAKPAPSAKPLPGEGTFYPSRQVTERPVPSAEPQMQEIYLPCAPGFIHQMPLEELRALLAAQGLAIVKASDVPSAEDKRVLEAMTDVPEDRLQFIIRRPQLGGLLVDACEAELARRGAKGTGGTR